jgi:hypothetical protein
MEGSLYFFLLEVESTLSAIERMEGLSQLKNPMSSWIEPATFRLVILLYLWPQNLLNISDKLYAGLFYLRYLLDRQVIQ